MREVVETGRQFRRWLTLAVLLIVTLALVVSNAFSLYMYRKQELDAARRNLNELLNLMDAQSYTTNAVELLEQFTKAAPDKRLTVISSDGIVLADSLNEVLGDHSGRPEVIKALENGVGEAQRWSETTGQNMLYVARVFTDGQVGRAAMPLDYLNTVILPGIVGILVSGLVGLGLAFFMVRKLARSVTRPMEDAEVAVAQVDERFQSSRSEFTANVTHELKTPLTSIKGFTDMMASGLVKGEEDQKRFLTMISVEVDRLINLINDILKISELESVQGAGPDDRSDMLIVVTEAVEFLRPTARAAEVTVSMDGGAVNAAIAPARLREVALNLVENAIKYNKPGGVVRVRVTGDGKWAILSVADTGIGIPEGSVSRVFERFYRVDKGRSRIQGGTGLGLSIVKHIAALYGGAVFVESNLGQGSVFTVRIPLAR